MRPINQRALLFTYKQRNHEPDESDQCTNVLPVFKAGESSLEGGVVADIDYGKIISISMFPAKNRRVLSQSGYIVRPMHDIETYRLQIKNNEGFRFIYIPSIRGGFQAGIYRIDEWDISHKMTTGGKNKVYSRAEFVDTDSFIVDVCKISEEYNRMVNSTGLPVRNHCDS